LFPDTSAPLARESELHLKAELNTLIFKEKRDSGKYPTRNKELPIGYHPKLVDNKWGRIHFKAL
jgi:hypothetical protein